MLDATVVTAVVAVVGAALGWWPIASWAHQSSSDQRVSLGTVRIVCCALTAGTFGALAMHFGLSWILPALLAFAAASTVLIFVDLVERRLPNDVVFPTLGAVCILLVPPTLAVDTWWPMLWALAGAAAMFAVYFLLALISPASMGMGDVKLALLVGLVMGWFGFTAWLLALLGAFVVGGVIAITALVLRRVTLRGSIPFGPSMLGGAFIAILLVGP